MRKLFRKEGMSGEKMVGGLGSVKERDADVDIVIAKVRDEIEAKAKVSEILSKFKTIPEYLSIIHFTITLNISPTSEKNFICIYRRNPYALTSSP